MQSSRPERSAVKAASKVRRGIGRHFEGWQPAALSILLAGSTALIAVPRPVEPVDLPEPRVDMRAIGRTIEHDLELARRAERERLDVDVLELGTALFAYGEAEAAGDELRLMRERRRVIDAAARAAQVGEEPVLALRAHHQRTFIRELHHWAATGEVSERLQKVGGRAAEMIEQNGWIEKKRLVIDDAMLAVMFKKRFREVTALSAAAFAPTLEEERLFYRALLRRPGSPRLSSTSRMSKEANRVITLQYRLKKVEELSNLDPSYPLELAKGVLLYRLGRYPQAVESFRRHLEASPDGPGTLRAQNYLRAALEQAREE